MRRPCAEIRFPPTVVYCRTPVNNRCDDRTTEHVNISNYLMILVKIKMCGNDIWCLALLYNLLSSIYIDQRQLQFGQLNQLLAVHLAHQRTLVLFTSLSFPSLANDQSVAHGTNLKVISLAIFSFQHQFVFPSYLLQSNFIKIINA